MKAGVLALKKERWILLLVLISVMCCNVLLIIYFNLRIFGNQMCGRYGSFDIILQK